MQGTTASPAWQGDAAPGWGEPGRTPEENEYMIVLKGGLVVETRDGKHEIKANEAVMIGRGERVR